MRRCQPGAKLTRVRELILSKLHHFPDIKDILTGIVYHDFKTIIFATQIQGPCKAMIFSQVTTVPIVCPTKL